MDFALSLSLVTVVIGVIVAVLSLRMGSAPGWTRYRSLALVGLTASAYAALSLVWALDVSPHARGLVLRGVGVVAALHVMAWQSYVVKHLGPSRRGLERTVTGISVALAVLWLVPGLMFRDVTVELLVPWLGQRYRFPDLRWTGSLAFTVQIALFILPLVRYVQATRAGLAGARLHTLALSALLLAAVNDTLASSGVIHSPLLVACGFVMAVGALGWDLTRTFVTSARELDRLSKRLEQLVAERTHALVEAEATLLRTEKMAALGQLSAGVAHEINNPSAAVGANLAYLRDALARGEIPHDAVQCAEESLEGVARITKIVAQLLDSGRAAAHARGNRGSTVLRRAVQHALTSSKARFCAHLATSVDIPHDLLVRADESSLVQVLVNLLVNAAQSIPVGRDAGLVSIRATVEGDRVVIDVTDNGSGMSETTQRRLFEPFYTTKSQGQGTGLGLSVSLGLVRAMGGEFVASSSPAGTSMKIILERGEAPPRVSAPPGVEASPRRRLLLVDDDRAVARALARALGKTLEVTLATGVADAREKLQHQTFDIVLSDVQMPDGGGRRVYEELAARTPELAKRVILFSGGPPSEKDRAFFETNDVTVLEKPLAACVLLEAVQRLCG